MPQVAWAPWWAPVVPTARPTQNEDPRARNSVSDRGWVGNQRQRFSVGEQAQQPVSTLIAAAGCSPTLLENHRSHR